MKFFIGGEYFPSPLDFVAAKRYDLQSYSLNRFKYKYTYFTGGGIHSLFQILKHLNLGENDFILLPSYICPSVIIPFNVLKIKYKIYKIDSALDIDINFLKSICTKDCKALLFINYFGFPISDISKATLLKLSAEGILLIQDLVHGFFSDLELIGDFCFNSFRKFSPYDGSIISSKSKIETEFNNLNKGYVFYKILGQFLRFLTLRTGIDLSRKFISFLNQAEIRYNNSAQLPINKFFLRQIEKMDFQKLQIRRKYFKELLENFLDISLYKYLPDNVIPVGFPIVIDNRDNIRERLKNKNIYCPIHWTLPYQVDREEFSDSFKLSNAILTLPITENITINNFNKYVKILKETL